MVCYFRFFFKVLSHAQLFVAPWTVSLQAPLSIGFSKEEYWGGLPFPSPGELSNPGIEPGSLVSPALAAGCFTTALPWKPTFCFKEDSKRD